MFTQGKSGRPEHLLADSDTLQRIGASYVPTNRGGDITFHGPGQQVGYPILDLDHFGTDLRRYLYNLEEVIIRSIAGYGLKGERSDGETGVWLDAGQPTARKICAMGVRTSRWVTMHGWALNVNTDLKYFDYIVPCGIRDKGVTSLARELGRELSLNEVKQGIRQNFEIIFDCVLR